MVGRAERGLHDDADSSPVALRGCSNYRTRDQEKRQRYEKVRKRKREKPGVDDGRMGAFSTLETPRSTFRHRLLETLFFSLSRLFLAFPPNPLFLLSVSLHELFARKKHNRRLIQIHLARWASKTSGFFSCPLSFTRNAPIDVSDDSFLPSLSLPTTSCDVNTKSLHLFHRVSEVVGTEEPLFEKFTIKKVNFRSFNLFWVLFTSFVTEKK